MKKESAAHYNDSERTISIQNQINTAPNLRKIEIVCAGNVLP